MAMPPLLLEQSLISRLLVEAEPAHRPAGGNESQIRTEVRIARTENDAELWQVELSLRVVPDERRPGPYRIELSMHGYFRVPAATPADEATRLLGITGASILYSAAREHLLLVTGRGPWGPLQLPTTRFVSPETGKNQPSPVESKAVPPKRARRSTSSAKAPLPRGKGER